LLATVSAAVAAAELVQRVLNSSDTAQVTSCGGTLTTLGDYNDYANLNLAHIRSTPDAALEVIDCTNAPSQ